LLPFLFLWALCKEIGFSLITTEKIWLVFLFLLPGISMYYCASVFNKKQNSINILVAAVFYMFSPLSYYFLLWPIFLGYSLAPLMLGLFIQGLKTKKYTKFAILIGLSSLLFSCVDLLTYVMTWTPILFYIVYYLLIYRRPAILTFTGKTILAVLLLNFYVIVKYIFYFLINSQVKQSMITLYDSLSHLENLSRNLTFLKFFRISEFSSNSIFKGDFIRHFLGYDNTWLIFLSFTPIIIILIAILGLRRNKDRNTIFFFILILIGLFFSKGIHSPFGSIYIFLFENIPGFWVFKSPNYRFLPMVILAYSLLFGRGVEVIRAKMSNLKWTDLKKNTINKTFIFLIVIIILLNSWPLLTGDVVTENIGDHPSYEVKVPSYWFEMSDYINQFDENSRVFILPGNVFVWSFYQWEKYSYLGSDTTISIIKKPIVSDVYFGEMISNYTNEFINNIYLKIKKKDINKLSNLLSILGVQYMLQRNDFDWTYSKFGEEWADRWGKDYPVETTSPDMIKEILSNDKNISLKKTFGELDLYELSSNVILPHIYTTQNIIFSDDNIDSLTNILSLDNYTLRSIIYFNKQENNLDNKILSSLNRDSSFKDNQEQILPKITFVQINPTKYKIKVESASEPYTLVFSETFHKYWKLYINSNPSDLKAETYGEETANYFNGDIKEGTHRMTFLELATFETWDKEPISEGKHLVANGYANSWYIEPSDVGYSDKYELIVEFWPQRICFIATIISGLAVILSVACLIYIYKKSRRSRAIKRKP